MPSKKQKNLDRYHAALNARVGLKDIKQIFKNKGLLLKLLSFIIVILLIWCRKYIDMSLSGRCHPVLYTVGL